MKLSIKTMSPEEELVTLTSSIPVPEAMARETERYSITPTTFAERSFEGNLDNWWYIDKYQHADNSVSRFGIRPDHDQIRKSIIEDEIKILDMSDRPESTVKSGRYTKDEAGMIKLSSLEQDLLRKAITFLLSLDDPDDPQKAVLVDILVRGNGGTINGAVKLKDGIPESHTVVLYKNPDLVDGKTQIVVIDPSNFLFSSHLSNFNQASFGAVSEAGAAAVSPLSDFTIVTIHKGLKIYQPIGETGPMQHQYRDCIDVAAKIALGLNSAAVAPTLLISENIESCQIIKNLSNSREIDNYILEPKALVRIKQRSDIKTVEAFNKVEKVVYYSQDVMTKLLPLGERNLIKLECTEIFHHENYATIIRELCDYNATCLAHIRNVYDGLLEKHESMIDELRLIGEGDMS